MPPPIRSWSAFLSARRQLARVERPARPPPHQGLSFVIVALDDAVDRATALADRMLDERATSRDEHSP
jgi:hypothetical protein